MLCTGPRRSRAEAEPSVMRPSAEPSCSASGCQSPSHSAASLKAISVCLTMLSLRKPPTKARLAPHFYGVLPANRKRVVKLQNGRLKPCTVQNLCLNSDCPCLLLVCSFVCFLCLGRRLGTVRAIL